MTPIVLAPVLCLLAQASTPTGTPGGVYRVGPGDILEVAVAGRPDLSRLPTVQTTGTIWLPLLDEVPVAGLTMRQVETRLAELLGAHGLLGARVEVVVKEYQSQLAWVVGTVNRPSRVPLNGRTRLVDALLAAGGFAAGASGEVLVERREGTFPDGSTARRFRFDPAGLGSPELQQDLTLLLQNGDIITATTRRWVSVTGEVVRAGRYPLEGELSLARAVAAAGGLTRFGGKVTIRRRNLQTGQEQILEADVRAIQAGREADVLLQPDDQVVVGAKVF
jgi:polysaccharide export outer membrane protein